MGMVLAGAGLATKAGALPQWSPYTYPVAWWGLLPLVDAWNARRRGLSLWREPRHLVLVTMPTSVLFWVYFELLNLPAPQWRYRGTLRSVAAQVAFGFAAFATVIPIMVEAYWLVGGQPGLPSVWLRLARAHRAACLAAAALVTLLPTANQVFWFNQGMWLAPALMLLPFLRVPDVSPGPFVRRLAASGLVAGLAWEAINYRERTRWEYLILPRAPRLFAMPVPGYLGFIPFGLSALAVHHAQRRVPARPAIGALLWAGALGALWWTTRAYRRRGLWIAEA